MATPPLYPSFSSPARRKDKLAVEPLVGLQRLTKQLEDLTAAVVDPTWMVKELRAMIKTIKSSVELLRPQVKDWTAVTPELKELVSVISILVKRLASCFETHLTGTSDFLDYINGSIFTSDFNKLMTNTRTLLSFLLRFGIDGGLVSEIGCSQYALPTSLWRYPIAYLPDRNLLFAPRNAEMRRLERSLAPADILIYRSVYSTKGSRAVGITEMMTEYSYRSIEDGVFGVVAWITCSSVSSIIHSFRAFGKRIRLTDNSFCKTTDSIADMDAATIVEKIVDWLQKLSYPWLLVFDGVNNSPLIGKSMIPQFGCGTVVFTTHAHCLHAIKDVCCTKPESLEVHQLGHTEKMEISHSLLNNGGANFDESEIIALTKYFGGHPLEIIEACHVISTGNSRLQLNIGVESYLNKLRFAEARGMLERDLIVYQTLNAALDIAVRLPSTSTMAVTNLLDLLPYIDGSEIDVRMAMKWLLSGTETLIMSVLPDNLEMMGDTDVAVLTTGSMLTVKVSSVIPHNLHSNGGTHHSWKIEKTFIEMQTFFDDMKKSSQSLAKARFPGKPHGNSSMKHSVSFDDAVQVSLSDINFALQSLCIDPSWKSSLADPDVKSFIGIIPNEDLYGDVGSRIVKLLQPLIAVGIVRMKHRFGLIDNKEQCVSFSVCSDFHSAMVALVKQEAREEVALDDVYSFLLNCAEEYCSGAPNKLPAEVLLPSVLRAVSFSRHTEACLSLVDTCFMIAENQKLFFDQVQLARAGTVLVHDGPFSKKGTADELLWCVRLARSTIAVHLFDDAAISLTKALDLAVKLNAKYDIAVIQGLLAEVSERLEKYTEAENHLVKSLEAWQLCFHENKQKDIAKCLQQIARVYRITNKVGRSLEFDIMAIDLLVSLHGANSEIVLDAHFNYGCVLMHLGRFDAAIATFTKIIQSYESIDGNVETFAAVTSLKMTHSSAPTICIKLAECYVSMKQLADAELILNHCLDCLFNLHRERPHESVALVLSKLGDVQTDQGKNDAAVKSLKDAVDIFRCIYAPSDTRIGHALNKVGDRLKLMGKYAFAESYYKGAAEIFEKRPCRDAAYALIGLAELMMAQDRLDEALKAALKSVSMYWLIPTSDESTSYEFAAALVLTSDIFKELGQLDSALERLDNVQMILEEMPDDNDIAVAEIYEKVAEIYRLKSMKEEVDKYENMANTIYARIGGISDKIFNKTVSGQSAMSKTDARKTTVRSSFDAVQNTGKKNDAVTRQESSDLMVKKEEDDQMFLKIQEELITKLVMKYGEKHQRVASALNNLSHLLIKKERYDEAHRMLVASLEILLFLYGDTHPHVATVYQNIGHVYQRRGRYEEAEALFQRALEVRRDVSGDVSAHVAQSLNSLGLVYRAQGKYLDAKLCMEESLAIRRVLYGHSHFSIAVALNNLGMLQKNLWLYKEAETSLRDGLSIRKTTFDEGHPSIAISMVNLGSLLVSMGKFGEGRMLFEQALAIQKKAFGEKKHPDISKTLTYLAELNIHENKMSSAQTVLDELVRVRSDIHGTENDDYYTNISRLSRLYHAMNLREEAERLDQILSERPANSAKSKIEDKFVMLPEIEEDDKIVSRLMSFGSFDGNTGHRKKDNFHLDSIQQYRDRNVLTSDNEEIPRWLANLAEAVTTLYRKKKQEVQSSFDVKTVLQASYDEVKADLQGLQEALEENKSKIVKLEKLSQTSKKYQNEIISVQYDSANTEGEIEIAMARLQEIESDRSISGNTAAAAKRSLKKLEEVMPKFESLRVTVLASISNINSKEESLREKQQLVLDLTNETQKANWDGLTQRRDLESAEHEKLELEAMLRIDHEKQGSMIEELYLLCQQLGIEILPPSAQRSRLADCTQTYSKGATRKQRSESDVEDDDNTSIDSFNSREDSGSEAGGSHSGDKRATLKMRKKIKRQKMLIDLLRSQLVSLGVRPIEEVVAFERAEARLKDALQRLLEGNEDAAAEFERWDEYVRNHPEYKRREQEKHALWMSENIPLNVSSMRNIKTFIPEEMYTCTKDFVFSALPRALARRVWNEKALWLLRMNPLKIAKMHIADLQSKYSTQGLDEIELRAVYAALPVKFENDSTGEKENWRLSILQRLQSKRTQLPWSGSNEDPPEEVVTIFMKSISRNGAYRNAPENGPFDPDILSTSEDISSAVFQEAEKYDPRAVYSSTGDDQVPSGSFSILETVQIMHNKMTRQRGGPTVESTTLPQTVEEDALRQERRQASLAKLRNQKASLEDVEAAVLHSTEDGVDDSFEMFPSRLRIKTDVPPVKGPMMSGLHEAVLKRRAMLDAKSPSSRQLSSRNLEVAKSTGAPERGLSKGESFRAAPTRAPMVKGESYRAGPSNSNSVPNRRGMMLGQASQKSIMLTGPHHSGAQDDEPVAPKQGIARQQSMLGKLFNKRAGGDVLASPRPTGSPTKQRSQKSAFNLFTLNEDT